MTKIPEPLNATVAAIDKAHQDRQEKPRYHMGASLLGHHCDRWLWLNFRWAVIEKFPGRILRLFRRGHHEEKWIVDDLKAIGVDIIKTEEDQARVNFGGHVAGSLDGIIKSGLPEAPKTEHVAEFKTHSKKSFDDLVKKGVEDAKPMHFVQMQIYMFGLDINRAFYLAVNKDDDSIYTERLKIQPEIGKKYIERGERIATADRMPEPCSGGSATWYQCKWCAAHSFCWEEQKTKEVNCRTCANVTATESGNFQCEKNGCTIPNEAQHGEYDCHAFHPDLVPWQLMDSEKDFVAAYQVGNNIIHNGEGYTPSKAMLNPIVEKSLGEFECNFVRTNNAP